MMSRRITTLASCAGLVLVGAASLAAKPAVIKWPPWLSIESPVNPFDPTTRGAVLLVHAITREGPPAVSALSGSAEGIVNGARRTIPLRLDTTPVPGVFAVGDVRSGSVKRVGGAIGEGAQVVAALHGYLGDAAKPAL